jgi:hypothetical protein
MDFGAPGACSSIGNPSHKKTGHARIGLSGLIAAGRDPVKLPPLAFGHKPFICRYLRNLPAAARGLRDCAGRQTVL